MQSTNTKPVRLLWTSAVLVSASACSVFGADIIGTKRYMYMAVLNAGDNVVVAVQDNNELLLQLDFIQSGGSVSGSSGFSLGTAFSLDTTAPELGTNQAYLVLDSVNPADVAGGAIGTVDLMIADAGGPMPFTVAVAFRKLSDVAFTVFDGYVTSTPPTVPAEVQIVPTSVNLPPPAGWGLAYAWGGVNVVGLPLGISVDVVPDLGAAKIDGYVAAYGGVWAAQDGSFELSVASASAGWENACTFTSAISLRVLSDLTLFENEILPKAGTAIAGAPADDSFVLGAPVVTGGATLSINTSGLVTAFSATGYPQDQVADVAITDGARPQCTPRIAVNFRTRGSDGYTIVEGHLDGEGNIVGAAAVGYSVAVDGTVSVSGGGAVTLAFDSNAEVVAGPIHVGGIDTWNDDGSFVMTIQDGLRPLSRLDTDVALRRFPSAGMTFFDQQNSALAQPAIGAAAAGTYEIIAVEPADSSVPLAGGTPRSVFDTSGALVDFLNASFPSGSDTVNMRVTDGGRPYSVAALTVDQRWIADAADAQAVNLNLADADVDIELRVRDSQNWDWQTPSIPGLSAGSVVLTGGTMSVDAATFDFTGAVGSGSLSFELVRAGHPAVTIDIPLTVALPPGIPAASEWGLIVMTMVVLIFGTVVFRRGYAGRRVLS